MLNEGLKRLLATTSAVTAIVGTQQSRSQASEGRDQSSGIFFDQAPKDSEQPLIVYAEIHGDGEMTMDGPDPLQYARVQFSCYATDYANSKRLARVVRQTLEVFTGALYEGTTIDSMRRVGEIDTFEEAPSLFLTAVDFEVAYEDLSS